MKKRESPLPPYALMDISGYVFKVKFDILILSEGKIKINRTFVL